jgi:acyl-CoA reductase-like NAD-dependent aldehyde dehydrogenase
MPRTFETKNPATGEKLETYELFSEEKSFSYARRARETYDTKWKNADIDVKTDSLRSLARSLRSKKRDYARLMTLEMGKPITQSEAEIEKCAWTAELYAVKAEEWMREEFATTDARESYVVHDPLGVILSIMPWNFPFWQALRFAIPALLMGNTSVLRHSNVCPASALAIERAFKDSSFPEDAFSTIITDHDVASNLIASDLIRGVSLTGSVEAGRRIGEQAGRNLKKFVLELGGSDPFIVLEDANVERASKVGADARLINSGQSCIAAKRFIVVQSVAKQFTENFVKEFERRKTGDPLNPQTDVGPLVNKDAVKTLDEQVRSSISKGARIEIGGKPGEGPGSYYEPTVLSNVDLRMPVMCEEAFGPVAPIYVVESETEAIQVANGTEYGLGASLWTNDYVKAKSLVREIESGCVFVNALVKSDARMPFGGIKSSGIGRELSRYGLYEFSNTKSVNIYDIGQKETTSNIE